MFKNWSSAYDEEKVCQVTAFFLQFEMYAISKFSHFVAQHQKKASHVFVILFTEKQDACTDINLICRTLKISKSKILHIMMYLKDL